MLCYWICVLDIISFAWLKQISTKQPFELIVVTMNRQSYHLDSVSSQCRDNLEFIDFGVQKEKKKRDTEEATYEPNGKTTRNSYC